MGYVDVAGVGFVLPDGRELFTDVSLAGRTIRAVHIAELRAALNEARAAIGLPPIVYSVPSLTIIRASHITELRAGVQ